MEIVRFTPEDQEATTAFMRAIYKEMDWPEEASDSLGYLAKFFHLPYDGVLLLLKNHDEVVGTGGFVKLTNTDVLLKRFYIEKTLRGTGIAQKLWSRLLQSMKSFHANRVVLDVSKKNSRAIRFYEKNGFKQYQQEPVENWKESSHPDTQFFYFLEI